MDETLQELERQYCPPLDAALFHAIAGDYDTSNLTSLNELCETLDSLKLTADVEEASSFDPSGSSNTKDVSSDPGALSPTESTSTQTSVTDVTTSFSAFTFEEGKEGYDNGLDSMSKEEKGALLHEMFPDFKPIDIDLELKRNKEDFGSTTDTLLSRRFLAQEADENGLRHHVPKGVEGFAATESPGRMKKGKRKKNKAGADARLDLDTKLMEGSASKVNRWNMSKDDIKYITDRTSIPAHVATSLYNGSGHSLPKTILTICMRGPVDSFACTNDAEDPLVQTSIVDLRAEFPAMPISHAKTLIMLTHPLFVSARELASVVTSQPEIIVPQYARTKLENAPNTSALLERENDFLAYTDSSVLPHNTSFDTLRNNAFAAASAAYRKSRSSPLMGGAAAYYASVGHTANAAMKRSRAIEANSLVATQSNVSDGMVDLHGVTVADANRIAKQYVDKWWESRAEWAREGTAVGAAGQYFRVVVGRGAHSQAGRGKLGPAVAKMLRADGWRVEEQIGELVVKGKARK